MGEIKLECFEQKIERKLESKKFFICEICNKSYPIIHYVAHMRFTDDPLHTKSDKKEFERRLSIIEIRRREGGEEVLEV